MKKYFGTDGIRGVYGLDMTEELCFKAGAAIGRHFGGECLLARDSRLSGPTLSEALIRGLNSAGARVKIAGVLPTPAVSFLTKVHNFSCGIMVSASHNPPEYNGIKVFSASGLKLNSEEEMQIEYYINNPVHKLKNGSFASFIGAREQYIEFLTQKKRDFSGYKVILDSANGAVGTIAGEVFSRYGADVALVNETFNGALINAGCGALYIESLKGRECDFAFGFDGDGDRVAAIYKGEILDGDSFLYSLSRVRELKDDTLVGTIMSNSALEERLGLDGKRLMRTQVGDKNIVNLMVKNGYTLGGEQSGHYIFYPQSASGDGILAALNLAGSEICRLDLVPQKTVSVFAKSADLENKKVKELIAYYEKQLKRLLVRMSGTEPKVRVTAESADETLVDKALNEFTVLFNAISH